jgi:hypothetical protein
VCDDQKSLKAKDVRYYPENFPLRFSSPAARKNAEEIYLIFIYCCLLKSILSVSSYVTANDWKTGK